MVIIISGNPITKKNSQRIIRIGSMTRIIPSQQYKDYEVKALSQLLGYAEHIDYPVTVKCMYYMATKRRVDLTNLLEATDDILVKAGVLEDDNSKIIASHDGSRVLYDKTYPRVEICIEEFEE